MLHPQVIVEEGNKEILQFLRVKKWLMPDFYVIDGNSRHISEMKYHLSWDALKPVIDEIFNYALAYPEQVKVIRDISIVVEIGACWEKVVQFIKWYNIKTNKE